MSIGSRFLARLWNLPAPSSRYVVEHRNLRIPMLDGIELLADRYHPRGGENLPVILIRSPYGRGDQLRDLSHLLAERGFQVLLQSCRGTGGSGGSLHPSFQEEQDGVNTIDWLGRQPWYCGRLALLGTSYLGNAAWAAVQAAGSKIAAMALHATLSNASAETYAFEGFTLEGCLAWTLQLTGQETAGTGRLPQQQSPPASLPGSHALPLRDADLLALGRHVSWWQEWVNHAEPGDPFWNPLNFTACAARAPATAMIGGWHDIFLPWQIQDYAAMQAAGRPARLTIGPWVHSAVEAWGECVREALLLFGTQLLDKPAPARVPVRLYVMGAEEWREFDSWPPPGVRPVAFYLAAGGALSTAQSIAGQPSCYAYNPEDPTPALHGPRLSGFVPAGDMALLESRSDVLLFTGEPLHADLDVIGPVSAELFFRSSLEHTDFFLVLCDVTPTGCSTNVCDGYIRVRPNRPSPLSDGSRRVRIEFWPTAFRFRQGHRIRIVVASGAHPRYARNLGSGETLADGVTLHIARQQIFHDPLHPSRVLLPIAEGY